MRQASIRYSTFAIRHSLFAAALALIGACAQDTASVTVYCSVDEEFARQVLDAFTRQTGIVIRPVFDSEAGKTTGLVNRIRAEKSRPRADVLFSSEVFNTLALAGEDLLAPYDPPAAADIPPRFRDPKHRWTAIGLRGRVLAFDPKRIDADDLPDSWEELARPESARRLAFANPLFGTTKGHVAAMFALWGEKRATTFIRNLRQGGALIVDGNSSALRAVIDGRADLCATDTDDVWVAQQAGASIDLKYLDMGDGGTLWIPCTVAMIRGARNESGARRLVDFLVSSATERLLAKSRSRNVPVRPALRASLGVELPAISKISYSEVAAMLEPSTAKVREILLK